MSSAATTATAAAAQTFTFWCHDCDLGVPLPLPLPSAPLLCPLCRADSLEPMETIYPPPPPPPPRLHPHFWDSFFTESDSDELDLGLAPLSLPLIYGGALPADQSAVDTLPTSLVSDPALPPRFPPPTPDPFPVFFTQSHTDEMDLGPAPLSLPPIPCGVRPADQSVVDALPTVLVSDPALACAVCKDEFGSGGPPEARRLPCGHVYHPECILPWLARRNSCPLCRSPLPSPDPMRGPHEEDEAAAAEGMGATITGIVRLRRRTMLRARPVTMMTMMPTRLALRMAEAEISSVGPASSGETVTSEWTGEGGSGAGRDRVVDDEGDAVMSEIREQILD